MALTNALLSPSFSIKFFGPSIALLGLTLLVNGAQAQSATTRPARPATSSTRSTTQAARPTSSPARSTTQAARPTSQATSPVAPPPQATTTPTQSVTPAQAGQPTSREQVTRTATPVSVSQSADPVIQPVTPTNWPIDPFIQTTSPLSDVVSQPRTQWTAELGALASSSGRTPFWLQANQFGRIPEATSTGLLRLALHRIETRGDAAQPPRKFGIGYGVEVMGQAGATNRLLISEAYLKLRWGRLELFGGRRQQIVSLLESPLSSGSFIWSGNALPMPRVQLGFADYVPIGFTKNWVSFKGFIAHGWFGNGNYVQGSYLHQKALFVRLGAPQGRLRLYGAFNHEAQWGGYAPFLETEPGWSFQGRLPSSLEAYWQVLLPLKSDALKNTAVFTSFDQNRVGDHRGSGELGLEWRGKNWSLLAYQQHFYDIGRKLYNLRNIEDGLYGIQILNHRPQARVAEVVLELLNTGNQGTYQFGKFLGGEAENYFQNGQYADGWSYQGRTLGSPFLPQQRDTNPALDRIAFIGTRLDGQVIRGIYGFNNNRVWALYGALRGTLGRNWGYQAKASFSRNYGTFTNPFPVNTNQVSTMATVSHQTRLLKGAQVLLSVGYDQGSLLINPVQWGGYLGIRKQGLLF